MLGQLYSLFNTGVSIVIEILIILPISFVVVWLALASPQFANKNKSIDSQ